MAAGYAAAGGAAVGALGGYMGARSANKSSEAAANLLRQYAEQAAAQYRGGLDQMTGTLQPWMQLGSRTMPDIEAAARTRVDPTLTGFNMQNYFNDPGYQFQLQQGQQGINQGAAARGNFFAPATVQKLGGFQQGLASTGYDEAFNRYMQQGQAQFGQEMGSQQQLYNQLAQLLGYGSQASSQLGQGQLQTGQWLGQGQEQLGSDLANLRLGRQNPWAATIQGAISGAGAGMGMANAFGGGGKTT
jgi:hypothetical protein